MNLRTAAVFGGSGKVGHHLIALLEEMGLTVRVLQHNRPVPGRNVSVLKGSVGDLDTVRRVVQGVDLVVQLATSKEDQATYFDVSMRGTLNVLEACRLEGTQQFMLLGGDAAFGIWFYPQHIPINENHPHTAYPGCYAFSKVMEEVMTQQYGVQYKLPYTILRSSWIFTDTDILNHLSLLKNVSPAEKGHSFGRITDEVAALVEAGVERIPILTDSVGTPLYRHIVHIDDLMQAFHLAIGNQAALNRSFNIAGPAAFSYDVAAAHLARRTGIPTIELVCPDYHSFEIDTNRARCVLGYAPQYGIKEIIDRALAQQERGN